MKPRIALAINNLDTAGMKFVLAAVAAGIADRFDVTVLVNKKTGSPLENKLAQQVAVQELMLRSTGWFQSCFGNRDAVQWLKTHVDLLHDFDYTSDWTSCMLARRAGIPAVVEKTNLSFDSYRWRLKLGLAAHIICLSAAQRDRLHAYRSKLSLIPTGVDIPTFADAVPASRALFGLRPEDVVLVSVAHLVPVKGYEELIAAMAGLKAVFPNLKLVAVGKGHADYVTGLQALVRKAGVEDRVLFAGDAAPVPALLKMADGKILATQNRGRREAFGAALVEAMAASLPVIATRSGGPEDIVADGITGFLVAGDGPGPLMEALRRFMASRDRWHQMGKAGYDRAMQFYQESQMVSAYAETYKKILDGYR